MSEASPGQQWYAWFVAHTRQPHQHPPWERLSRDQQQMVEVHALRAWEWASAQDQRVPEATDIVDAILAELRGRRGFWQLLDGVRIESPAAYQELYRILVQIVDDRLTQRTA